VQKETLKNADHALRAWYLARARKTALAEQVALNATPNTLVNADTENLKRIIEVQNKAATKGIDASLGFALAAAAAVILLFYFFI
jgi:hypothetical protein